MSQSLSDIKQAVARVYNSVNQEMFEIGVKRLRVDIIGSKIVILAEHRRIPGLKSLDKVNRFVTRLADVALLDENKKRLKEQLESELGIKVKTVLKDYDPEYEVAATVAVLYEPLTD
ncbi:MAG: DUF2294 domain-containing protein [Bacillota bacterium]